ncbi:MarR family winged helix-turn-helix transcriptional regulator [Myceligenerans indicum]|uniref:Winged helix-turn-helix transcriptional regulator n=1 Tax=Myceligenerans indicum TaxID=2593663 RepID=A0ABS1LQ93_9MICO|nr:MarR family winged helix-turn-helix transcriptional regulator [Myceligenerans indicum]MBL0888456.1 winged helix-turn-helix transcriptional regulator [Myceligenerans indicum]
MLNAPEDHPPEQPPAGGSGGSQPIAVALWKTAQPLIRGFDAMLTEHGTSWQVWHILLALSSSTPGTQRALASAVGIREATLTHHLRTMEDKGLIVRTRMPENRRVQHVEVTEAGGRLFDELKTSAIEFDRRLRDAIGPDDEVSRFLGVLGRLAAAAPEGGRDILPEDWPRQPGS